MTEARATWIDRQQFNGIASSGHTVVVDGDKAAGNSPMELVLIALCGCANMVTTAPDTYSPAATIT